MKDIRIKPTLWERIQFIALVPFKLDACRIKQVRLLKKVEGQSL
jgi:hypothetical protein